MDALTENSKKWEGRVVDGKFPLRQWLGGSDHSAVFLTERSGTEKAAIKLIAAHDHSATNHGAENLLSRWAVTARIAHPNLIRMFEFGRCQLGEERFLYVVMEQADEDLGQIIPQRPLAPAEVAEMLPFIVEALSFLHGQGFVHGAMKPSNVFAVGNRVKISADNLHNAGEPVEHKSGVYSAPEAGTALSPASDVWSVGALLIAVLTQKEPDKAHPGLAAADVPEPYRSVAQRCLKPEPSQRCKLSDVLPGPATRSQTIPHVDEAPRRKRTWPAIAAFFAFVVVLVALAGKMMMHRPASTPVPVAPEQTSASPTPTTPPVAPKVTPAANQRGSVLHQVLPDISRQAQKTIHGRVKIVAEVRVDSSGNVTDAKLTSPGPSHYFAGKVLAAARQWRFTPPQVDGQPSASAWALRFELGRGSTQVIPKQTKP